ncbi:MAG: TRAP transporter substrate-binding protein DctP [Casimicrobiaceae bacterium]
MFASAVLAASLACPAQAQDKSDAADLKLSTALGPAYAQGKAGETWSALIRERSAGRIAVKYFPGAMLVGRDAAREFAALREGAIDLAVGSALVWSVQVPELNLTSLPWLVPDDAALDALLAGEVGARIASRLEAAGVLPLALVGNGFPALATRSPVHKPADLTALKLRVPASPIMVDTIAALGAASSSMPVADARAAFASGALDGQEIAIAAYAAARLDSAGLTYLLLWEERADALILAVNRARWSTWSEADQALVRQAAQDAAREAAAMNRRASATAAIAALARQGVVVTRLTPAGKSAFRAAALTVYQRWGATVGDELVRAAEAALSATSPIAPATLLPRQ